jgi:hypothetical protein
MALYAKWVQALEGKIATDFSERVIFLFELMRHFEIEFPECLLDVDFGFA